MKAIWAGITLSEDNNPFVAQHNFSISSDQIIQQAGFIRSGRSTYFSRGNRSLNVSFSVSITFRSPEDAELYSSLVISFLPSGPDTLELVSGGTSVFLQNTVLQSATIPSYVGAVVNVNYVFKSSTSDTFARVFGPLLVATELDNNVQNWTPP